MSSDRTTRPDCNAGYIRKSSSTFNCRATPKTAANSSADRWKSFGTIGYDAYIEWIWGSLPKIPERKV